MAEDIYIKKRVHKIKSLDKVRLCNNFVLCKAVTNNLDTPINGVYRASAQFNKNQFLDDNADRVLKVIKVCDRLSFFNNYNRSSDNSLRWKTTIQIEEGDIVIASYPSVLDYDAVLVDGVEYMLINYSQLRLAIKPDGSSVMLNGWQLYKRINKPTSSLIINPDPRANYDYKRGIVVKTGNKNVAYRVGEKWKNLDLIEVKEGDVFEKETPQHKLVLESDLFRTYSDEDLFIIQLKDIVAILN